MTTMAHEPEVSFVPSVQTAGRGVYTSLRESVLCCSGACLVNLGCTLHGYGRRQEDLGNWALEQRGRI